MKGTEKWYNPKRQKKWYDLKRKNIEKLKKRGLIPAMTKGKNRWRITFSSGKQEVCCTSKKVKSLVQNENVVKVEKKKIIVELKGIDLVEKNKTNWHDVTSYYLL